MEIPISNKPQISPGVYHATLVQIDDVSPGRHGEAAFQFKYQIQLPGGRYRTLGRTYYGPFTKDSQLVKDVRKIFACAGKVQKVTGPVESELLLKTQVRLKVTPSPGSKHYRLNVIGPEPVRGIQGRSKKFDDIER
jgi:hypothetical protein